MKAIVVLENNFLIIIWPDLRQYRSNDEAATTVSLLGECKGYEGNLDSWVQTYYTQCGHGESNELAKDIDGTCAE